MKRTKRFSQINLIYNALLCRTCRKLRSISKTCAGILGTLSLDVWIVATGHRIIWCIMATHTVNTVMYMFWNNQPNSYNFILNFKKSGFLFIVLCGIITRKLLLILFKVKILVSLQTNSQMMIKQTPNYMAEFQFITMKITWWTLKLIIRPKRRKQIQLKLKKNEILNSN